MSRSQPAILDGLPSAHPPVPLRALPSRERRFAAVALFMGAWLYVFPYFASLSNPNENVRLYMTAALVDEGTYEISSVRRRWGWVNDAACVQDVEGEFSPCSGFMPAGAVRRYYSVKAPLASFLALPGYAMAKWVNGDDVSLRSALWWARLTSSGIPCVIFLWFFFGYLGSLTRSAFARDLAFVAFALGSVFLGYAFLLASHSTSAATAFGSFMLLHGARRKRRMGWLAAFFAGMFAAATSALEYPCASISMALCLYALIAVRPWTRLIAFVLGALLPTLLVMHFQGAAFGNPFSPGHLFVETEALRSQHEQGFFGADQFHWSAAGQLLFGGRVGLFTTTPFFLLAIVGLPVAWRRRRLETLVAGFACTCLYLTICFMNNWEGGWTIGPRYLVAVLPFFAAGSVLGLERLTHGRQRLGSAVGLGLLLASLIAGGMLSVYYPHVPSNVRWPVVTLLPAILRADLAPHTLLDPILTGNRAMLPVVAIFAAAVLFAVGGRMRRGVALAVLIAATLVCARWFAEKPDADESRSVQFVLDTWEPR